MAETESTSSKTDSTFNFDIIPEEEYVGQPEPIEE
jgi:hypothetical protein